MLLNDYYFKTILVLPDYDRLWNKGPFVNLIQYTINSAQFFFK